MRAPRMVPFAAAVLCAVTVASPARAQQTVHQPLQVSAQVTSRTSLRVSARILQFDVVDPAEAARVAVDFAAGARTVSGADVVLTVEALRAPSGPGGAADVETALSFAGEGEGTTGGSIVPHRVSVAARWPGSGRRTGRFVFSLQAAAPGSYVVPLQFVLSTP